jgi:hypothetical protein
LRLARLHAVAVLAIFAGALVDIVRVGGTSPIAWTDTFNDEVAVQACLVDNTCTLFGLGTSLPGLVHTVGWLDFRTLLEWLGLGLRGTVLVVQAFNALAAAIVFDLATLLSGPLVGTTAVFLWSFGVATRAVQGELVYNTAPLLFMGAVFVVACTAAIEKPSALTIALAALVAAILANVHLACVLAGFSVIGAALCAAAPPGRAHRA